MNFNLTLIGQSFAFLLFVAFCMRYVWPPLTAALRERQRAIEEGLAAAERNQRQLQETEEASERALSEAREEAAQLVAQANRRAKQIVDEAKAKGQAEAERQKKLAQTEIDAERERMREELRLKVGDLVVQGASRVLQRGVDADAHRDVIDQLAKEL